MNSSTCRAFESGETTQIRQVKLDADLLLVLADDELTHQQARKLSDLLGCELLEVSDPEQLTPILALRQVTMVLLAIDARTVAPMTALRILSESAPPPSLVLLADLNSRLLASTRRLARERGLRVAGVLPHPLNADTAERLCTPLLRAPPVIPRGELERALAEHEMFLLYQPKMVIEPAGLRFDGVEAFVRWRHPRRGILRPSRFLASLERENLLTELMDFVMCEAIRQAGQWREGGLALQMAINLSPGLVRDHEFPERLDRILREYSVAPRLISLDLTENPQGDRALALEVFAKLRLMGVGLALDNFGTGYSSLTELHEMPYNEVKIDGALISEVPHSPDGSVVVRALVQFAHALGLRVCAEGVETSEAVRYLREVGCDALQGRIVSGPVEARRIEELVALSVSSSLGTTA
jgi:EAL domain-containing protein (putative c-di-GMP-specific phosphodiesterase class I)